MVREKMRKNGISLTTVALFDYEVLPDVSLPKFDSLICQDVRALSLFLSQWGNNALVGKSVATANCQVSEMLQSHGCQSATIVECDNADDVVIRLAASYVAQDLVARQEAEKQG